MPKPLTPNFVPGVGALTTYRDDFQSHVNGTGFRHNATQIDLSPAIDGYTTVQEALNTIFLDFPPVIPSATPSVLGLITLGGDLNGIGTTAFSPKVSGLQGRPVQNLTPSTGQVLTWSGAFWGPATAAGDVVGPLTSETVVSVSGDVSGTINIGAATSTNTINIGGGAFGTAGSHGVINIGAGTFSSQIVIGDSPASPQIQLGNGAGSVLIPNLSSLSNTMVIALPSGQLSTASLVTYTSTVPQSLNVAATLATSSSITVGFTNVTATSNTINYNVDSGPTPDFLLLVGDAITTGGHTRDVNLPTPTRGRVLKITDASASANIHNITINATGGAEVPGGGTTITIAGSGGGSVELISDGTNWFITGSYNIS